MLQLKYVFTTGEVARLLKVTTNTVSKWFDAGFIKGFTHPGSTTRRVSKEDLDKFIKKHDIPLKRLQKDPFLTTAQCATFCFVTTHTITKWIDRGLLPSFNLGTDRRLVFYRDLLRFMKDNKIPLGKIKDFTPPKPDEEKPRKKPTNGRKKKGKKRGRPRKKKRN